jgi:FdhD protein
MSTDGSSPTTRWRTVRYASGERLVRDDTLTTEGPVEFRLGGVPIAVLMRTPGRDVDLGIGFLISEGIVVGPAEVDAIRPRTQSDNGDRYDVVLAEGITIDPEQFRRNVYASSSCGVCGKASIDAVLVACRVPPPGPVVEPSFVTSLPDRMRKAQEQFSMTGSLHAAALFSADGELLELAEDVGRHNAVDKVIGAVAVRTWPIGETLLMVSGRISFEIAQKCAVAGVPFVAGVSGASSLAAELGEETGVTVCGFVRGDSFNVYSGSHRIVG